MPAKHTHTGMSILKKEVPVCFSGGQGCAGMPYRSISSHFEPCNKYYTSSCRKKEPYYPAPSN